MDETGYQLRGHKANLSNPRTSEESKERSRQVISELQKNHGPAKALGAGDKEAYHDSLGEENPEDFTGGRKVDPSSRIVGQANLDFFKDQEARERTRKDSGDLQPDDV